MQVIVASKNPVKVNAVKLGFEQMLSDQKFDFEGIGVPSGVSDQPMSNLETYNGAFNRAKNAMSKVPSADYWVGIEGGIEMQEKDMGAFAWIVILSSTQSGKARTGTFFLPPKISSLVQGGMELGDADDIVFQQTNSKQNAGAVGLLTNNCMDRTSLYLSGIILALIPFKNVELY